MKKLFSLLFVLGFLCCQAKDDNLYLYGRVKESTFKTDLTRAKVRVLDRDGVARDSVRANSGRHWNGHEVDTIAEFYISIPRVDSVYTLEIACDGYQTEQVDFAVEKVGKRETYRQMPTVYLQRSPRVLNEVKVTSSKIKFYNKGDTLVYNADAFQLAEGSMLDALIAQLPGVELNNNGQIKVNGEFVESLLLNGKEFMDGNNNLMLENIGAYTVKNIQVYEGQTPEAKRKQDFTAPKVLTMDVRLKKEYNIGWVFNGQAGYGTEDRYMGRLFASWFNPTTRVSFVGNINNLNDNRAPGKNDTWTPEQMPTGTKENRIASVDYNYENHENTKSARGGLGVAHSIDKVSRTTFRTNFLPGGDTYDNTFGNNRNSELKVRLGNGLSFTGKQLTFDAYLRGEYERVKNVGSELSGAFSEDEEYSTYDILDAIFTSTDPEKYKNVLNMSKTRTDGWRRRLFGSIAPYISYRLPKSQDALSTQISVAYESTRQHDWTDYNIRYGLNPSDETVRRQYTDGTPDHNLTLQGSLNYRTSLKNSYLSLTYVYTFNDRVKDSYMYALDRLNDMGIFGVLPEGYLHTLDAANSYTSRLLTNTHGIRPFYNFSTNFSNQSALIIYLEPEFSLVHRHLDYWRNDKSYRLSKTDATVRVSSIFSGMIEYRFNPLGDGRPKRYRNTVRYSYRIDPTLPEMTDMIDIVDDSNPLNIYFGNPDLKTSVQHRHLFRWSYTPASHTLNNILYASFSHTSNALTRGYTYNTSTGVRYNRMYNVDGTRSGGVTNELNWQFGSKKQFSLSSETDWSLSRLTDMVGVDLTRPAEVKVNNRMLSERLKLGWQVAGQSLQLRCDVTNRRTTSSDAGFNTIDATHYVYGLTGIFKLPAGFGVSTDFMCYTRRGYGVETLDTTDPVWNVRASYCPPRHNRWVFIADGFDLLHKLSNVNYAVTATGRTVSYTNTIPRYLLFSVQYRFNIQPKKR